MKQKTWDGNFTVQINEAYLEESQCCIKNENTAIIRLFAEQTSVTLEEVADAIISCTFRNKGLSRIVDVERFPKLNVYLKIKKSNNTNVTYNFNIPNYQSTEAILPAIARNITI